MALTMLLPSWRVRLHSLRAQSTVVHGQPWGRCPQQAMSSDLACRPADAIQDVREGPLTANQGETRGGMVEDGVAAEYHPRCKSPEAQGPAF